MDSGASVGISIAVIFVGVPLLCLLAFFVNINMRYSGEKRSKYYKWRFSHSNAKINWRYLPKETRDALWAEIQAPPTLSSVPSFDNPDPGSSATIKDDLKKPAAVKTDKV